MQSRSCATSVSAESEAMKQLTPILNRILAKLSENEAAELCIHECPAPCRDRTVEIVTKSGALRRAACPIANPECAYGRMAVKELEARLRSIMLAIGVPMRYLRHVADANTATIAAESASRWETIGFLVLCGKPGSGKSSGAACTVRKYLWNTIPDTLDRDTWKQAERAVASVVWLTAMEIAQEREAQTTATNAALLVIDDLGGEDGVRSGISAIRHVISKRYGSGKPTVITTALTLDAIAKRYGHETVRRISEDGRIVDCGETLARSLVSGCFQDSSRNEVRK